MAGGGCNAPAACTPGTVTPLPSLRRSSSSRSGNSSKGSQYRKPSPVASRRSPRPAGRTMPCSRPSDERHFRPRQGVWFVELARIRDPGVVIPTIAHLFGVTNAGDQATGEELTAHVQRRELLLILDNLAQVPEAALFLHPLRDVCPR